MSCFQRLLLGFGQAALFAFFDRLVGAEAGVGDGAAVQVGGPGDRWLSPLAGAAGAAGA